MSRRAVLLGVAGIGVTACTATGGAPTPTATGGSSTTSATAAPTSSPTFSTTTLTPTPPPTPTASAMPDPLPASAVWPISPNEPEPMAKKRAVRLVESLTAWGSGQTGASEAAARLVATGIPAERAGALAAAAAPFLDAAQEATSRVISAQYGGLATDQAAILVTYEQWTRDSAGSVVRGGSAAEVRLARQSGQWTLTELHPAEPGPPQAGPSTLVGTILAHPRIHLPPSAAADIAAGDLMPKPMQAMVDLAGTYEINISIVHSAHPTNVFATNRLSDHTRGRAFDVWAVNGQAVIASSTPDAVVDGFLRATVDAGASNVGGPRQLSGSAFFSDRTHRDHTHIAFNADT